MVRVTSYTGETLTMTYSEYNKVLQEDILTEETIYG